MDIGLSATRFLLFHSGDCGTSHEITEGNAAIFAFMHDVPQQNRAEPNGLDDC
jgi:hypothetical protein